ncbi:glycerophosphodiester phosphodiesterase [Clostridium sp. AM58-1XD]|uniref:glycerophosphodiester phosphodiesterase n=1 Tax=Clostridium sp. AM58-1XD TaxID=2292307 RepID=UPI000E49A653|nr:glycerophosphodiester phosphodiesterase [Clostridium sp. AM58-1XD]RGY99223.1 glycerophosphodiester phosphodiesterase [Clostridium sp. AM58-1XD]
MEKLTREVRQVIRLEGWNLLLFELFYRLLTVPIYLWLLDKIIKFTLRMAGYSFLTTENIGAYFLKPWTILSVILLIAAAAVFLMVEMGSLISAFQAAAYYRRLSVLEMFAGGVKKTADELAKKNWRLFGLILIQTFLGNMLFLYRILIRVRPINFILDEFFNVWPGRVCTAAAILVLAAAALPGVFTFHGCMVEQKNFTDSYRKSRRILMGRWKETFLPLAGYHMAVICLFTAAYLAFVFCLAVLVINLSDSTLSRAILFAVRDRAELLWLFMAGIGTILVYCAASTVEYYQYTSQIARKKSWNFEYPAGRLLERKKVLLAVIGVGLVSTLITYDAFRNGLGLAEEVLVEIPVTAHRGSSREAPENTMAAIEKAVENMAEFAEIDVQMTKDGEIVLAHDKTLRRTAGVNRKIQTMNFEEIKRLDVGRWFSEEFEGERVPALREVMEYAKGRIKLNIEVKDEGRLSTLPEETAMLIEEYDMADQCVVSSVSMNYLKRMKEKMPEITAGYIVSAAYGDYYSDEAVDFISIRSSLVDKRLMNRVHEKGKAVHVWTVNTKNELQRMKFLRADNIITDRPVLAKEVIYGEAEADSVMECMRLLLK